MKINKYHILLILTILLSILGWVLDQKILGGNGLYIYLISLIVFALLSLWMIVLTSKPFSILLLLIPFIFFVASTVLLSGGIKFNSIIINSFNENTLNEFKKHKSISITNCNDISYKVNGENHVKIHCGYSLDDKSLDYVKFIYPWQSDFCGPQTTNPQTGVKNCANASSILINKPVNESTFDMELTIVSDISGIKEIPSLIDGNTNISIQIQYGKVIGDNVLENDYIYNYKITSLNLSTG